MMKLSLVLLLSRLVLAQDPVDLPITSQYRKARTSFNGVTLESAVGYLPLNDSNTISLPVQPSETSNKNLNYTIMAWFKIQQRPQIASPVLLFTLNDQTACFADSDFSFLCEFSDYQRIAVKFTSLTMNQWFHFTLAIRSDGNAYLQLETNFENVYSVSASEMFVKQTRPGWFVCLGQCIKSIPGLTGGIRELVLINSFVDPETASIQKNMILPYSSILKAYFRFQGNTQAQFSNDQYNSNTLTSGQPVARRFDMLPVDVCPGTYNQQEFYRITQSNLLMSYDVRTVLQQINYSYTMLLTLQIDPETCYTRSFKTALRGCNIVNFKDVFMLYFEQPNQARIHFFAQKNYFESQSIAFFVPFNQIITIQLSLSQKSGYKLFIFNQWGQVTTSFSNAMDLQRQVPGQKLIIFQGLEGVVKTFKLFKQQIPLPIYRNVSQTPLVDLDLSVTWVFSQSIINQGTEKGFVQFFASPTTIAVPYRNFLETSASTFDGIACENNQLTLQLNTQNSKVDFSLASYKSVKNQSTVEFWFKLQNPASYNTTSHIFSMYDSITTSFYWQVLLQKGKLVVAPFGLKNFTSPTITIPDFQPKNEDESGWWHLSCGYTQADSAVCTIYNTNLQIQQVTYLAATSYFVPNSTLRAIFGKLNATSFGAAQVLIKEFRYWNKRVPLWDLQKIRYRQLDPTSVSGLVSYVRLIGGLDNFLLDLVQLSIGSAQKNQMNNSFAAVSMVTDFTENNQTMIDKMAQMGYLLQRRQFHTVCPLQTYYFEMQKVCVGEPVNEAILAVFPFLGSNGRLAWLFTLEHSAVLNETLLWQLQIKWKSEDYFLNQLLQKTPTILNKLISADAFRQENFYEVTAGFENSFGTSLGKSRVTFVPDRCNWFEVDGIDAYSGQRELNVVQGVQDISFFLVHRKIANCTAFDYYTQFDQLSFKFFISNSDQYLTQQPQAIYQVVTTEDYVVGINVTLPANEQFRLPTWTDIKILMALSWKGNSSVDSGNTAREKAVFQHAMFKINFAPPDNKLLASLTSSSNQITRGQDLLLDASNTTVTNLLPKVLRDSLYFSWKCPIELQSLCFTQNSSRLTLPWSNVVRMPIKFGQIYSISVTTTWIQSKQTSQNQTLSVQVVWYNSTRPSFTIQYSPSPILVSASRATTFQLSTANFNLSSDLLNYNFNWSIDPQLDRQAHLQYLQSGSQMRVSQEFWQPNTEYQVSLNVSLRSQPNISAQRSLNFSTGGPPSGGKIETTPSTQSNKFIIGVSGWVSQLELPLFYNIFKTFDTVGQERQNQLNTAPIPVNQTFELIVTSGNPYQVQIFDISGEQITNILYLSTQNSTLNVNSSSNLTDTSQNGTGSDQANLNKNATTDTNNLNNTFLNNSAPAQTTIADNSTSLNSQYNDNQSSSQSEIPLSSANGRNLQTADPETLLKIEQMSQSASSSTLFSAFDYLLPQASGLETHLIELLERAIAFSDEESLANTLKQVITRLRLLPIATNYQSDYIETHQVIDTGRDDDLRIHDARLTIRSDPQSISVQQGQAMHIVSVKKPQNYGIISLWSTDKSEFVSREINSLNSALQIKFDYQKSSFHFNQTMCVVGNLMIDQQWETDFCLTEFDPEQSVISCTCNMMQFELITVREDSTRISTSEIKTRSAKVLIQNGFNSIKGSSYLLIALTGGLFLANVIGSLVAWHQDRLDRIRQHQNRVLTQQEEKFIREISQQLAVDPLDVKSRLEIFIGYVIRDKSLLFSVACAIHPLLQPFLGSRNTTRLTRFSSYMAQILLYSLACLGYFGNSYRLHDQSRHKSTIDQSDLYQVYIVVQVAGFVLLPLISEPIGWLIFRLDRHSWTSRLISSLVVISSQLAGVLVLVAGIADYNYLTASNQYLTAVALVSGLLYAIIFSNGLRVYLNFHASNHSRLGLFLDHKALVTKMEIKAAQECAKWLYQNEHDDLVAYGGNRNQSRICNQSNSHAELVLEAD